MNLTTFTIESVHGIKQTLSLETFTVGPQPKTSSTASAEQPQRSAEQRLTEKTAAKADVRR